jgi:hypothetical protein
LAGSTIGCYGSTVTHAICTIRYEGGTIGAFIRTLRQAGV